MTGAMDLKQAKQLQGAVHQSRRTLRCTFATRVHDGLLQKECKLVYPQVQCTGSSTTRLSYFQLSTQDFKPKSFYL